MRIDQRNLIPLLTNGQLRQFVFSWHLECLRFKLILRFCQVFFQKIWIGKNGVFYSYPGDQWPAEAIRLFLNQLYNTLRFKIIFKFCKDWWFRCKNVLIQSSSWPKTRYWQFVFSWHLDRLYETLILGSKYLCKLFPDFPMGKMFLKRQKNMILMQLFGSIFFIVFCICNARTPQVAY